MHSPTRQTERKAQFVVYACEKLACERNIDAVLADFAEIVAGKGIELCNIRVAYAGREHEIKVSNAEDRTVAELRAKVEGGHTDLVVEFRGRIGEGVRAEIEHIALLAAHRIELIIQGRLKTERKEKGRIEGLIGESELMHSIESAVDRAAGCDWTVLINGESGTGKGLSAYAIHRLSERATGPFVQVNCGAWPESMIEAEMFGHERGAFTGANRQHKGCFEQAHRGTLFLDEIGELSPQMQVKLLNVLQDRRLKRLGGEQVIAVDLRVIAATNRDLQHEIDQGRFRLDLFYRLDEINLRMPSLRDHPADIPLLAEHFLGLFAGNLGYLAVPLITEGGMQGLIEYHWPGNVRELETKTRHLVLEVGDGGVITDAEVEREISRYQRLAESTRNGYPTAIASARSTTWMETTGDSGDIKIEVGWCPGRTVDEFTQEAKQRLFEKILKRADGDCSKAAAWLGLKRTAFYNRMKRI